MEEMDLQEVEQFELVVVEAEAVQMVEMLLNFRVEMVELDIKVTLKDYLIIMLVVVEAEQEMLELELEWVELVEEQMELEVMILVMLLLLLLILVVVEAEAVVAEMQVLELKELLLFLIQPECLIKSVGYSIRSSNITGR
jgi:hypothetical protein